MRPFTAKIFYHKIDIVESYHFNTVIKFLCDKLLGSTNGGAFSCFFDKNTCSSVQSNAIECTFESAILLRTIFVNCSYIFRRIQFTLFQYNIGWNRRYCEAGKFIKENNRLKNLKLYNSD